ncbi:archaeal-type glutamate synthase [Striga asiatica]|uniref:Archaeal-type glutamate synthase n=1 Tax=Striga asiatica TaxID=4170 RepID=A0A5A7RA16_STRAF|nr:archaeal-type glutamate synthase [Striga asiatica]
MDERVKPSSSAFERRPDFSTELRTFCFSSFLKTSTSKKGKLGKAVKYLLFGRHGQKPRGIITGGEQATEAVSDWRVFPVAAGGGTRRPCHLGIVSFKSFKGAAYPIRNQMENFCDKKN